MRGTFATCCEIVIQDARNGNLSLINIMDNIGAIAFPVVVPRLAFMGVVDRRPDEPSNAEGRLTGRLNGNELFSFAAQIDFQGKNRTRVVGEFLGLVLPGPGTLSLTLTSGEHEIVTATVDVTNIGNPQAELFGGPGPLQQTR